MWPPTGSMRWSTSRSRSPSSSASFGPTCGWGPRGFMSFQRAMPVWMKQKLWVSYEIEKGLRSSGLEDAEGPLVHRAPPGPRRGRVLPVAVRTRPPCSPSTASASGPPAASASATAADVELLRELHFPDSLGLLYSAFTYHCGFRVNSGEYKLMGLAPYGEPRYADRILDELVDLRDDGSFTHGPCATSATWPGDDDQRSGSTSCSTGPPASPRAPITQREMDLAALDPAGHRGDRAGASPAPRPRAPARRGPCSPAASPSTAWPTGASCGRDRSSDIWVQPAAGRRGRRARAPRCTATTRSPSNRAVDAGEPTA